MKSKHLRGNKVHCEHLLKKISWWIWERVKVQNHSIFFSFQVHQIKDLLSQKQCCLCFVGVKKIIKDSTFTYVYNDELLMEQILNWVVNCNVTRYWSP